MSFKNALDRFDSARAAAKRGNHGRPPQKTGHVVNEHGIVSVKGPALAVDSLLAFVQRNRGK